MKTCLPERVNPKKNIAISISGLSYRYPRSLADAICIPHWQVGKGERIFLQGASGSGKSTLLQLLCGLKVGSGELQVAGIAIGKLSQFKRDRFRAHHIGMVFQQFNLIPYLSMIDNVVLAANLVGQGQGALARGRLLLNNVGLPETFWEQPAASLSIGQQQRVAIVRALINTPDILLLDEPTSSLDDANKELFIRTLMQHLDAYPSTTVVFVSHDIRLTAYFDKSISLTELSSVGFSSGGIYDG